jgi:hypothetical protein
LTTIIGGKHPASSALSGGVYSLKGGNMNQTLWRLIDIEHKVYEDLAKGYRQWFLTNVKLEKRNEKNKNQNYSDQIAPDSRVA